MREVLQVIGQVLGAVELDQATDERANEDVQFDEPVHGRHCAGPAIGFRDTFLAWMPRNAISAVTIVGPTKHKLKPLAFAESDADHDVPGWIDVAPAHRFVALGDRR